MRKDSPPIFRVLLNVRNTIPKGRFQHEIKADARATRGAPGRAGEYGRHSSRLERSTNVPWERDAIPGLSKFHSSIQHERVVGSLRSRLQRSGSRRLPLFGLQFRHSEHSRRWAQRTPRLDIEGSPERSVALLQIHQFRMSAKSVTLSTSPAGVCPAEGAQPPHEGGSTLRIRLERGSGPAYTPPTMEDPPTPRLFLEGSNVSRFRFGCSPLSSNCLRTA